jgi:hypothetical protein
MCHAVRCKQCGKTTWSGCGRHVADVRAHVPAERWCPGHDDAHATDGWLRRIIGR